MMDVLNWISANFLEVYIFACLVALTIVGVVHGPKEPSMIVKHGKTARDITETRPQVASAVDAVADAWASIDGKLDEYRAGKDVENIFDEPGGHFSGYQEDAKKLVERIEKRGFKLVPIDAALGSPPAAR